MRKFLVIIIIYLVIIPSCKASIRVISLSPNITETIHKLISLKRDTSTKMVGTVYYTNKPNFYKKIPDVGNYKHLDIKKILNLKPDLVITWKNQTPGRIVRILKKFNIKVLSFSANTIEELSDIFFEISRDINLSREGIILQNKFKKEINQIKKNHDHSSKKNILLQISENPIFVIGKDKILNEVLRLCSGENIFSQTKKEYLQINLSEIIKKNPEVIIMIGNIKNDYEKTKKSIWEGWGFLKAVRTKEIYIVSERIISQYSPKLTEGIKTICKII